MYVRPPNSSRAEFKLPENYSGNAFNRFSTYADMPPPTKTPINKVESSQTKDESYETGGYSPSETLLEGAHKETSQIPHGETHEEKRGSLLSSLLPDFDLSRHFPFGHGIGSEEILILAVMLIVFVSGNERGEVDSELLLLLGLLLFAG